LQCHDFEKRLLLIELHHEIEKAHTPWSEEEENGDVVEIVVVEGEKQNNTHAAIPDRGCFHR